MFRLLRINMTSKECRYQPVPEVYLGLGGRALASSLLAHEVPTEADPLGPQNKLIFATGLLSGTPCVSSARISLATKSPMYGGIASSNAGGAMGSTLSSLGILALVIEGADTGNGLYLLEIDHDAAVLKPSPLQGLDNFAAALALQNANAHAGDDGSVSAYATIGVAGERSYPVAGIVFSDSRSESFRHGGRGGVGAVMGAKGLKAIVIHSKKSESEDYADKDLFTQASKRYAKAVLAAAREKDEGAIQHQGCGRGRANSCMAGCIINCPSVAAHKDSKEKSFGKIDAQAATLFTQHGQLNQSLYEDFLLSCDDMGIDIMDVCDAIQRATQTHPHFFIGCEPADRAKLCLEAMREGTELGRIIGAGRPSSLSYSGGRAGAKKPVTKPSASSEDRCMKAAIDSTGLCLFVTDLLKESREARSAVLDMLNARFGSHLTDHDLLTLGEKTLAVEENFVVGRQ